LIRLVTSAATVLGWRLLPFVFAFAETLEDGETSLLGIAYGNGLEFDR